MIMGVGLHTQQNSRVEGSQNWPVLGVTGPFLEGQTLAGRSSFGKSGRARLAGSARWPKTRASKRAALLFHSPWARACQWETTMAAAPSTNAARTSPGCAWTIVMGQQLGLPACTRDLGAWRESLRSDDWLSPAERLC